ncbi:hypothetical protein Tco_0769481 [Tanacetum coccineum]|uniref:Uncharacterized protein n=1 Tax=Tanacetum coccineum TaxID=301880 RepID=A0ABQ4ZCS4_9ASTR
MRKHDRGDGRREWEKNGAVESEREMYQKRFGGDEDTWGESTCVNESHNNNGTGSSGGSTAGFPAVFNPCFAAEREIWLCISFECPSACFLFSISTSKLSCSSRNSVSTSFKAVWDHLSDDNSEAIE